MKYFKKVFGVTAGFISLAGVIHYVTDYIYQHKIDEEKERTDKFKNQFYLVENWLSLNLKGVSIEEYFKRKGYNTVAIYGMSEIGECLYQALKNSEIQVLYAIDKEKSGSSKEIKIIHPDNVLEDVDVVVVTPIHFYEDISHMLRGKTMADVVSIEDIVNDL